MAGAIEGALWNLPAIAFSKCVPNHLFANIQQSKGQTEGALTDSLSAAAEHARRIALETLKQPPAKGTVVNINFPASTNTDSPTEQTVPAKVHLGSLYAQSSPGKYSFRYSDGITFEPDPQSDREALERGSISHSILDFARIGQRS